MRACEPAQPVAARPTGWPQAWGRKPQGLAIRGRQKRTGASATCEEVNPTSRCGSAGPKLPRRERFPSVNIKPDYAMQFLSML